MTKIMKGLGDKICEIMRKKLRLFYEKNCIILRKKM